jgi:exodeoxyribonuclease VII small subunit
VSDDRDSGGKPNEARDVVAAVDGPGFAAAMAELEAILNRIETEETDIDALAAELKRAAVLLETCRAKIRRAEAEVTQIVQQLAEGGE